MSYQELLAFYIEKSELSHREISRRCKNLGKSVSQAYISQLVRGDVPPASEEVNKIIAEVTNGDYEKLEMAAFIEKSPPELKELLSNIADDLTNKTKKIREKFPNQDVVKGTKEFSDYIQELTNDLVNNIDFAYQKLNEEMFAYHINDDLLNVLLMNVIERAEDIPKSNLESRNEFVEYLSQNNILSFFQDELGDIHLFRIREFINKLKKTDKAKVLIALYKYLEEKDITKEQETELPITTFPVGEVVKVPIIGRVKAGLDGAAIQEHIGIEITDSEDIKDGAEYRWLQVYGDSMIGEGIYEGDLALVRIQPDVENGELAVVIVNGEYGAIKRVYKKENSIVLQSSNPAHPPRMFVGQEMNSVYIFGKVKVVKRKF